MTTQHNPDECARLIAEARADNRLRLLGAERELQRIRAMADQLEAAQAEIVKMRFESFTEATTTLALSNSNQAKDEYIDAITAERDKLQAELEASAAKIARLEQQHDGMCKIVESTTGTIDKLNATRAELESARKDAEHWRESRRVALEGGEVLKAELEAARPVVEAADAWRDLEDLDLLEAESDGKIEAGVDRLIAAADAYRAARDKAGVAAPSVTWRRGEADGRNGHPPAEITVEYLKGYAQGLENRP